LHPGFYAEEDAGIGEFGEDDFGEGIFEDERVIAENSFENLKGFLRV